MKVKMYETDWFEVIVETEAEQVLYELLKDRKWDSSETADGTICFEVIENPEATQ